MDELAKWFAGLFARPEAEDSFAQYLRNGNDITCEHVQIELDRRGVPFKWSRYECLHLSRIRIRYGGDKFILEGCGRFEMDNWSCTSQGDDEQKVNNECTISVQFTWPDSVSEDTSEGFSMIPERLRAVIRFLRKRFEEA